MAPLTQVEKANGRPNLFNQFHSLSMSTKQKKAMAANGFFCSLERKSLQHLNLFYSFYYLYCQGRTNDE
jgi:hypothetical protein